jgi:hypothetical protein
MYSFTDRVVVCPLAVLVKVIVSGPYAPGFKEPGLGVSVTVLGEVVAVPEAAEAVKYEGTPVSVHGTVLDDARSVNV